MIYVTFLPKAHSQGDFILEVIRVDLHCRLEVIVLQRGS